MSRKASGLDGAVMELLKDEVERITKWPFRIFSIVAKGWKVFVSF